MERLSVEGMMSRSFREADHQKKMHDIRKELEKVEAELSKECARELSEYMEPLVEFYNSASSYLRARQEVLVSLHKHKFY